MPRRPAGLLLMLNLQELELLAECCFGLLAQPTTDNHARHYGSLWRAQRARAPCMTRSTGRLVALPVQKATCNTWRLYRLGDRWG